MLRLPGFRIQLPQGGIRLNYEENLISVVELQINCDIIPHLSHSPKARALLGLTTLNEDLAKQGHPSLGVRSEEHTSELQSLMRISYAVFCLKKKNNKQDKRTTIRYIKQIKKI